MLEGCHERNAVHDLKALFALRPVAFPLLMGHEVIKQHEMWFAVQR